MRRFFPVAAILALAAAGGGCGGKTASSDAKTAVGEKTPSPAVESPVAGTAEKSATPHKGAEKAVAKEHDKKATAPVAPSKGGMKLSRLFEPPQIPQELLEKKEEPVVAAAPKAIEKPVIRLLGFSDVGEAKAILQLKGEIHVVKAGDTLEGVQIVAVNPPQVEFRFRGGAHWTTALFDPPWMKQQIAQASSAARTAKTKAMSKAFSGPSVTPVIPVSTTTKFAAPTVKPAAAMPTPIPVAMTVTSSP